MKSREPGNLFFKIASTAMFSFTQNVFRYITKIKSPRHVRIYWIHWYSIVPCFLWFKFLLNIDRCSLLNRKWLLFWNTQSDLIFLVEVHSLYLNWYFSNLLLRFCGLGLNIQACYTRKKLFKKFVSAFAGPRKPL